MLIITRRYAKPTSKERKFLTFCEKNETDKPSSSWPFLRNPRNKNKYSWKENLHADVHNSFLISKNRKCSLLKTGSLKNYSRATMMTRNNIEENGRFYHRNTIKQNFRI